MIYPIQLLTTFSLNIRVLSRAIVNESYIFNTNPNVYVVIEGIQKDNYQLTTKLPSAELKGGRGSGVVGGAVPCGVDG